MGEFSYTQPEQGYDFGAGYGGAESGAAGYGDEAGGYGGYEGYRDEVQSLVPEGVPMLAAILVEQGVISYEQVYEALAVQQETGDTIAQILHASGAVAADQLVTALQSRAAYR